MNFKNLNKICQAKKFYSSLSNKKVSDKEYEHVLRLLGWIWNKSDEGLSRLLFKMECFITIADVFEIFRNIV